METFSMCCANWVANLEQGFSHGHLVCNKSRCWDSAKSPLYYRFSSIPYYRRDAVEPVFIKITVVSVAQQPVGSKRYTSTP